MKTTTQESGPTKTTTTEQPVPNAQPAPAAPREDSGRVQPAVAPNQNPIQK